MSNNTGHTGTKWSLPVVTAIEDIRAKVPSDVLDYQQLVSLLSGYAKPRDKIGALLAQGDLVRVRKGLYVFGERYRHGPLDRILLANLVYGPSYVSLEYALSYHGLIASRKIDLLVSAVLALRRTPHE